MILFKILRYQNLLSSGNQFTTIYLNKSRSTLIVGENGAGKSTILDALMFALYGKPYRNINKPQLVNSAVGKNLVVEVEFTIGSKDYLVRRGMKPNIFEIHQNGKLIDQSSDVREYQELLEKSILKMNQKAFCQTSVLGSANFIPFMQLSAADRRTVVEDLLDIQVFSIMNSLLKDKVNGNKNDIKDAEHEINLIEQKLKLNEKHVDSLKSNNEELIANKTALMMSIGTKIEDANHQINNYEARLEELNESIKDQTKSKSKKSKIIELEGKIETRIRQLKKEIKFFEDNEHCPTCKQEIDEEFKAEKVKTKNDQLIEVDEALLKLTRELETVDQRLSEIAQINKEISTINSEISGNLSDIRAWNNSIDVLREEIESIKNNTTQIDLSVAEINKLHRQHKEKIKDKYKLLEQKEMLDLSASLLKDTGIKTKIIKQYIPVINKLVNKYLAMFDFFVNFELDDKFNETIKSRFRDEFSYASFSEGEKARLDLSLVLTWRAIAKLRNSSSTNLLIMDEVFDGSLNNEGREYLLEILSNMTDTNIFVITHNEGYLVDKFHSMIKFVKKSNFSQIATE